MILTVDIGNSNICFGVFEGKTALFTARAKTDPLRTETEYAILLSQIFRLHGVEPSQVTGAAVSSVVPALTPVFRQAIRILGEIPTVHDFEQRRPLGRVLLDGEEQPDLLADDTALACRTPEGLFILTGCSHRSICNIVSHAQAVCGEPRIAGILGGFHLPRANSRVEKTASFLASLRPGVLYPCHCVSLAAKLELAKVLPVQEVGCGMCVSF